MKERVQNFMSELKQLQEKYNVYLTPEATYCWDCDYEMGIDIPELELYLSIRDLKEHVEITRITEDELPFKL